MINTKQFNVSRSVYQPQIGSWGGSNLSYNRYDSNNLNYLVDTKENIQVNTDWVDEVYNEIFKQLLVSDEIYWVWDEENNYVRPLTIATSNLTFKTGVVNKVIQYSFEFAYGQTYKLVI
jgi:LPS O-antigen subunit length determinant protein (WzzB/FepE family)